MERKRIMTAINPVPTQDSNYHVQFKAKKNSQVSEPVEQKGGMSTGAKCAVGIGATALAAICIYGALIRGKAPKDLAIDAFKEIGKFDKGKAVLNKGKSYTGKITKVNKDGTKVVMDYVDGTLKKSTILSKRGKEVSEKLYNYADDGMLNSVTKWHSSWGSDKKALGKTNYTAKFKSKLLEKGNLSEFKFIHDGNTFIWKDGKIVSAKNSSGKDINHIFAATSGEDKLYADKINRLATQIQNKNKTILAGGKQGNVNVIRMDLTDGTRYNAKDVEVYAKLKNVASKAEQAV